MMIKIFRISDSWDHGMRVRETMMREALESCPVHLLYKDHKGWDKSKGGVPPTRHVAGGNRGVNLHLSEVVSDILEPMVGRVKGGCEVISTEDTLARFEDITTSGRGWTSTSWWEGVSQDGWVACGVCKSPDEYVWCEEDPALCKFDGVCMRSGDEDDKYGGTDELQVDRHKR